MINEIYTTKSHMTQTYIDGRRVPVTVLNLPIHVVTQVKSSEQKDGYDSLQVAIGQKTKSANKPLGKHLSKAKVKNQPKWIREIKINETTELKPGDNLPLTDIITEGDLVNVTGITIGKGFAGVMKRHGFGGGPRTHGQSDRGRAPGSIGRGTTPGRVLPGKKMAGRMGGVTAVTKNLKVVSIDSDKNQLLVSGPVPGAKNQLLKLTVTKKNTQKNTKEE